MRVFVLGTGRCGTTTFAKACAHVANFTSAHETPYSKHRLAFPDQHIEVSPHLTWLLGPLVERVDPFDALFVHLLRRKSEVVASWMKRGQSMGPGLWTPLARVPKQSDEQWREACELCYDAINEQIKSFCLFHRFDYAQAWLHELDKFWPSFWQRIDAQGDYDAALAELSRRHNATRS